jgi:23S rRNA pseudouridine1911/1915/1917 synthase
MYSRPTYRPRSHLPDAIREAVAAVDHQLLHAVMLGFSHPVTGERIERRSELPADYQAVVDAVRTG